MTNAWISTVSSLFWSLSIGLWLVLWFKNPYSIESTSELVTYPGVYMVLLSLVGVMVSMKKMPVSMVIVSVLSFFPMGWYLLASSGIFSFIGWLSVACFILSILMLYISKKEKDMENKYS